MRWMGRHIFFIAYAIIIISSLSLVPSFNSDMQGDVKVYQGLADDLFAGKLPYRDHVLEYPPYVIPIFLLPRIFGEDNYLEAFMSLAFLGDCAIKWFLFYLGIKMAGGLRSLLPLLCYSAAVPFIHFFYLQRYDILPALISLAAIWLFSSKRHFASGLAVAAGIGVKLYPLLFVPPLLVLALRQGKGKRFLAGLTLGLLPIVLLSFWLPWWRFAAFQTARGLQVESLYSSIIWLGKLLGATEAHWKYTYKWYEVHGPMASAILPWARGLFILGVGGSTLVSIRAASKFQTNSVPQIARLLLIPLLPFVALNQVFSPQYLIWLLPLAALASLEGTPWRFCAVSLAAFLTPLFYPVPEYYDGGLNLAQTTMLLIRNLVLITVWILLLWELFRETRPPETRTACRAKRTTDGI